MIAKLAKTLVAVVIVLAVVKLIAETARVTDRTIAWARDLPNRFEYAHEEFVQAATESIREGLHASDTETQLQSIKSLADVASQNQESLVWVCDEYMDDLRELNASQDVGVATNAAALLALMENSD